MHQKMQTKQQIVGVHGFALFSDFGVEDYGGTEDEHLWELAVRVGVKNG